MADKYDKHLPVLKNEVIELLKLDELAHLHSQARILDATLGFGGHSVEVVKRGLFLTAIDTDLEAIQNASKRLHEACPACVKNNASACKHITLVHGNFSNLRLLILDNKFEGILFDFGVNSPQLTSKARGMSFSNPDADLDMRLDIENQAVTASQLLNALGKKELVRMFSKICSMNQSRRLSESIEKRRKNKPFVTVGDLLSIIPPKGRQKIHPATKPFMALRIAVNSELENIEEGLPQAFDLLNKDGVMVAISFHSLEDKIVKDLFTKWEKEGMVEILTSKPVIPSDEEIQENPRSRSAKLRAIRKIHEIK